MQHITVFKKELIDQLNLVEGGVYFDATLGTGGHALELLEHLPACKIIANDLDGNALIEFKQTLLNQGFQESGAGVVNTSELLAVLSKGKQSIYLVNANFANIAEVVKSLKLEKLNGVYADLGWSTEQFERIPGLSHQHEESLDMRFDASLQVSAADLLNALSERELEALFGMYADIYGKEARVLVKGIVARRPFRTTKQLVEVITALSSTGSNYKLLARVFQALRIAVNGEYQALQSFLIAAWESMESGSLAVITFHSGEEKIVEQQFKTWMKAGTGKQIGQNPIFPSVDDLRKNLRARSARLWRITKQNN